MNQRKILQEITVDVNMPLLDFLSHKEVKGSLTAIKKLLTHEQVLVNQQVITKYSTPLLVNDVVTIVRSDPNTIKKRLKGITVVYEDEYIIVVDKQYGILSINTNKEKELSAYGSLSDYVKLQKPSNKIFILHRLDRDTSGLMIFARSTEVQASMQKHWDEVIKRRIYLAAVSGKPQPEQGTITSWLKENKNFVVFSSQYNNGGQKAITHYSTLKTNARYTLLNVQLETGRKNQIRVHLQSIGHSIVGDKKYGSITNPIKRLGLHAQIIAFEHPHTKQVMEFKSELPTAMLALFP